MAWSQTPHVLAHWSQIVGNSSSTQDVLPLQLMARFIVEGSGQSCSAFALTPSSYLATPTPPTAATTRSVTPADTAFAITVCQFEMYADWMHADLTAQGQTQVLATFPGPYTIGRKNKDQLVAFGIGDTGCRASDCDAYQGVNVAFKHVVEAMVNEKVAPDFAVHVGDYRYYHETTAPDAWYKWYMEFFRPAQPLLDTTPIALIRGNHEECDGNEGYWYGTRWYQFFEPTTSAQVTSCPAGTARLDPPWAFDVGVKTDSNTVHWPQRLVMVDNSPDRWNYTNFDSVVTHMGTNFQTALTLSAGHDTWWLMHKPLWSYPNRYASTGTQNALLEALGDTQNISQTLCPNATCNPQAVMAGHVHMYQQVDFHDLDWPIQYILGHGGVRPLTGSNKTNASYPFATPDGQHTFTGTINLIYGQNGFLKWTRSLNSLHTPSGWLAENCLLGQSCVVVSP